ncbi:RHS repeat domain-containing protein [Sphingomonas bacterium]|uniref:RHS repeat domain-containing protein n=1 Tax=Sphingomonas bacterium TaxID=1895847 RepID=UPI001575A0C3|nr:RHS repeat-associated core domain-containing protein [Sphingomonas bacterium]
MNCSTMVARRSLRTRRVVLLLSSVIGSVVTHTAFAQLAAPAPVRSSVDGNSVDLFLGTFNARGAPITLGASSQGLTYQQINTGSGWTDNTTVSLNQSGNIMTVAIGGYSDSFTVSGSTFTPTEGNGASLTVSGNVFAYTQSDGSVIHFNKTMAGVYPYYSNYGRVTDITSPSGLKETFSYYSISYCSRSKPGGDGDICTQHNYAYRVTTVSSTAGYSLTFNYGELDPYDPEDPSDQPNFQEFSTVLGVSSTNTVTGAAGPSESFSGSTDANNNYVVTITDPAGRSTLYRSNAIGIVGIRLPGSTNDDVTVAYNGSRVSGITTSVGTTTYSASDNGGLRTVTVTDPASHVTTYVFNLASQRMTSVTDALNHTTSSQYDGNGRITQVTRPEGDGLSYAYDGYGNVTSITANAKGGGSQPVSSASYPCSSAATCNKPAWTRDALGNQTDYAYDATTGEIASATAAAGANGVRPQTRYTYTSVGGVSLPMTISQCQTASSCSGGTDEVKTTTAYNANLLPTSVTTGAGDGSLTATTAYAYDAVGNVVSIDGPLPGAADTTTFAYDADRELVETISPDPDGSGPLKPRASRTTYNADGTVAQVDIGTDTGSNFAALQTVATNYDAAHRKVQTTLSAGGTMFAVVQYAYDGAGRLQCTAQRMNPAAFGSLPGACSLGTAGSFGNDRIGFTHYDAIGRTDYVTTAYGAPEAATEHMSYTANGKTASVTDANGNVTNYGYDGFDRALTTTYPGGSYEQLGYDANGNVTSRRLRDGQVLNYSYDALNRRTYDDNPNTNVAEVDVSYTYDNLGRVLTAGDQNGWTVSLSYDALGRVVQQSSDLSSNALSYDIAGNLLRQTWADGFYVTYDHLVTGEVSVVHENGGFALATFAYDDLGRRTSLTRGNGTVTGYAYDAASRLSGLTQDLAGTAQDLTLGFAYNPAGQIASRTSSNDAYAFTQSYNVDRAYSVNGLNQYTQTGSITPSYDGRGNLTQAGGQSYVYNTRNQLFQTSDTSQLFYRGPAGTLGQILSGGGGENLDYVGSLLTTELNGSNGAVLRRYVYGPGSDEPIVWYEGSGTSDRRYLHADERGSVIAVTNDAGSAIAIDTYDEYGIPGSGNIGRFQYTGQKWIPELGMYDYKARMYSPTLGRFLQTDPIGYGDGLNWYNYAGGDPVNFTDPSGTLFTCNNGTTSETAAGCGGANGGVAGPDIVVNGQAVASGLSPSDLQSYHLPDGRIIDLSNTIPGDIVIAAKQQPQNVDPPCKPGVNCKLPTPPNPCTLANNFCGPKPVPPKPRTKLKFGAPEDPLFAVLDSIGCVTSVFAIETVVTAATAGVSCGLAASDFLHPERN